MRRPLLLSLAALGAAISVTGAGLFAALTDTARTGTNSVESAALPSSADLLIAPATVTSGTITCGTFSDDLATGLISATGLVKAGTGTPSQSTTYFCLKNVGSQQVTVTAKAEELVDVETGCTGDESAFDTTCGAAGVGELSSMLSVGYSTLNTCSVASGGTVDGGYLKDNVATAITVPGALDAGATKCYDLTVYIGNLETTQAVQAAQSDKATWRIRFDAAS